MVIELRHLEVVRAVHEEGTVSRAAHRLNLTQPGVSHALKELEIRLRVPLFARTGKRMVLTAEGAAVLRASEVVLPELERLGEELGLLRTGQRGRLSLTTECYTCYHWLPPVLAWFRTHFPGVTIRIVPQAIYSPFEALEQGQVDVAIVHSPPRPGLLARRLFEDEMIAVLPPGHPLGAREYLTADDFRNETLILQVEPARSTFVEQVLRPAQVEPAGTLTLPLTEAVCCSVASGLGISVLAAWAIAPELAAGTLMGVRICPEGLRRTWQAVYSARRAGHRALQALLRHLEEGSLAPSEWRAPAVRSTRDSGPGEGPPALRRVV